MVRTSSVVGTALTVLLATTSVHASWISEKPHHTSLATTSSHGHAKPTTTKAASHSASATTIRSSVSTTKPVSTKVAVTTSATPSASVVPSPPPPTSNNAAVVTSGKRGLAWPWDNTFNPGIFKSTSGQVTWLYNWETWIPGALNKQFSYYAMQRTSANIASLASAVKTANTSVVLGLNEPDNAGQANLSPKDAASYWKTYIQPLRASGVKLVAPAITNGGAPAGTAWLDNFLTACTGCTFDAIAIHWYGVKLDDLSAWVNATKKYNKPLWLTEFGLDQNPTAAQYQTFLPTALKYLDAEPAIEKYAFFGAFHSGTGKDLINADGTLTALGKIYAA